MKRKLLAMVLVIAIAWFAVTVYFYCQHYRVARKLIVDSEIELRDLIVVIKEISYEKHTLAYKDTIGVNPYSVPWQIKYGQMLPRPLQLPFIKIAYLYSAPYIFSDTSGTIKIKGMIMIKKGSVNPEHEDLWNIFDITACNGDKRYYFSSRNTLRHGESNFFLFTLEGKGVRPDNDVFKIIVNDRQNKSMSSIIMQPWWEVKTYTYFDQIPVGYEFDPLCKMDDFMALMCQGKVEEARKYCLPEIWPRLNHSYWNLDAKQNVLFEGKLFGYTRVYSADIIFGDRMADNPEKLSPRAKQKIYYSPQEESSVIIGADPLIEYCD